MMSTLKIFPFLVVACLLAGCSSQTSTIARGLSASEPVRASTVEAYSSAFQEAVTPDFLKTPEPAEYLPGFYGGYISGRGSGVVFFLLSFHGDASKLAAVCEALANGGWKAADQYLAEDPAALREFHKEMAAVGYTEAKHTFPTADWFNNTGYRMWTTALKKGK